MGLVSLGWREENPDLLVVWAMLCLSISPVSNKIPRPVWKSSVWDSGRLLGLLLTGDIIAFLWFARLPVLSSWRACLLATVPVQSTHTPAPLLV